MHVNLFADFFSFQIKNFCFLKFKKRALIFRLKKNQKKQKKRQIVVFSSSEEEEENDPFFPVDPLVRVTQSKPKKKSPKREAIILGWVD